MMTVMVLEWVFTSIFLILVVLALRAALGGRMSAGLRYGLWAVVLLRLLVPVQLFTSPIAGTWVVTEKRVEHSVVEPPTVPAIPTAPAGEIVGLPASDVTPGSVPSVPKAPALPDAPEPPAAPDLTKAPGWLGWAWLAGTGLAALVLLLSNLRFYRRLRRVRIPLEGADCPLRVYAAAGLPSPCLFGLIRPAIYVTPEAADGKNPDMLRHVLAHEYTHYRHGDYLWSLLRCAALAVHWWNPLVWLSAVLSQRDGELACDEGALKRLGDGQRAAYGSTLLALVTAKPGPGDLFRCATTMAGDKKSLKERISRIAQAPKRVVWAVIVAVLVTALACVCAFGQAEPPEDAPEDKDKLTPTYAMDEAGMVLVEGLDGSHVEWHGPDASPSRGWLYFTNPGFCCSSLAGRKVEGSALWTDETRAAVGVVMNVNDERVESGTIAGFYIHFDVELDSGRVLKRTFESEIEGETLELTDQEMVDMARVLAKLLTQAEAYYDREAKLSPGPLASGQTTSPEAGTETVPAQVRADAEEFVRERFEALRDKGILFGLDGASVVPDPPEVDDWRVERLAGPFWSGELCWEVLGINRRVELWNVGYAFHTTTPEKAEKSMLTGYTHLMADGWLTQLNYGADYLVYELGEDGGRTLLTTFGEQGEVGSVSFRRSLRTKLAAGGVPEDMAERYFVEEHAELPLEGGEPLDLNRDGIPETVQVVGQSDKQRVEIWQGGQLLFQEEGFHAHAGWTSLFLHHGQDGGDYLLRYRPTMYGGMCTYDYQLFTLENGRETVVRENSLEFDVNFQPWLHQSFDAKVINAFMGEINGLLADSVQLLNTDEDLLYTFQEEGRLYDSLGWLDRWEPVFAREKGKSLLNNLLDFQAAMEAEWYADTPTLFVMNEGEDSARVRLSYRDRSTQFDALWEWGFQLQPGEKEMDVQALDLNGDGRDEVVFSLVEGHGTGCLVENLFAFDADTLEQCDTSGLNEMVLSSIQSTGDKENFYLSAPGMDQVTISKSEAAETLGYDFEADTISMGGIIFYTIGEDGKVRCRVGCDASGRTLGYIGYIEMELEFTGSGFRIARAEYRAGDVYSD